MLTAIVLLYGRSITATIVFCAVLELAAIRIFVAVRRQYDSYKRTA